MNRLCKQRGAQFDSKTSLIIGNNNPKYNKNSARSNNNEDQSPSVLRKSKVLSSYGVLRAISKGQISARLGTATNKKSKTNRQQGIALLIDSLLLPCLEHQDQAVRNQAKTIISILGMTNGTD